MTDSNEKEIIEQLKQISEKLDVLNNEEDKNFQLDALKIQLAQNSALTFLSISVSVPISFFIAVFTVSLTTNIPQEILNLLYGVIGLQVIVLLLLSGLIWLILNHILNNRLEKLRPEKTTQETVKKNETNDFVNLVKKNKGVIDREDLRTLLKVRLAIPSNKLTNGMKSIVTIIIALISANIAVFSILYSSEVLENLQFQWIVSIIGIALAVTTVSMSLYFSYLIDKKVKNVNTEEIAVMNQYLEAKKLIKDEK